MKLINFSKYLIIIGLSAPIAALAEGDPLVFIDVFGGYTWSHDQDAESRLPIGGVPGDAKLEDLDVHNGPAFGGRFGAWLKTHPAFGIAIDATHFDTDIDRQTTNLVLRPDPLGQSGVTAANDIRVSNTLVTIDLIWRYRGYQQLTPYAMVGPGIMFAHMDAGGFFGNGSTQDDTDVSFGFKAGLGVSYKLSDNMHIFTEYRYMNGRPKYDLERSTDPATGAFVNEDLEIDVDTHMALGGVSIRF